MARLCRSDRLMRVAAVEQRQLDVLDRARARQQVEALEHEPDPVVADARELVLRTAARRPGRRGCTGPTVGRSRQPRMCMNVDLPEPDGPVTRQELAGLDIDVHAAQRVHLDVADDVGLLQVANGNDWHNAVTDGRRRAGSPQVSGCADGHGRPDRRPAGAHDLYRPGPWPPRPCRRAAAASAGSTTATDSGWPTRCPA